MNCSLKKTAIGVRARLVGFGMVKIVELEQDSTSWKSSAGVGLAGASCPGSARRRRSPTPTSRAWLGDRGGPQQGTTSPRLWSGRAIGGPGGDAPIGKGTGFRLKRYNQTLVLIPILFQAIVVAVGFSAGLYFVFQGDKHWLGGF